MQQISKIWFLASICYIFCRQMWQMHQSRGTSKRQRSSSLWKGGCTGGCTTMFLFTLVERTRSAQLQTKRGAEICRQQGRILYAEPRQSNPCSIGCNGKGLDGSTLVVQSGKEATSEAPDPFDGITCGASQGGATCLSHHRVHKRGSYPSSIFMIFFRQTPMWRACIEFWNTLAGSL